MGLLLGVAVREALAGRCLKPFDTASPAGHAITADQTALIQMVAAGISDKEIGSALGEHANTVTHRIERLGRRHGFDSRMEFVVWATQVGLVR